MDGNFSGMGRALKDGAKTMMNWFLIIVLLGSLASIGYSLYKRATRECIYQNEKKYCEEN